MALENIHVDEFIEKLPKLLGKALSKKQKAVLTFLGGMDLRLTSTTQAVRAVSERLKCAESTVWEAVSVFREFDLIESNGTIKITDFGRICVASLSRSSLTARNREKAAVCKTESRMTFEERRFVRGSIPGSETRKFANVRRKPASLIKLSDGNRRKFG